MMNQKYTFGTKTKIVNGKTLRIILAVEDFGVVREGQYGGFIENERNLSRDGACWIFGDSEVSGNARVSENAEIINQAKVYGNAKVFGSAIVGDYSEVFDSARVYGNAELRDKVKVGGIAEVLGDTLLKGNAERGVFGENDINLKGGDFLGNELKSTKLEDAALIMSKFI